MAVDVIGKSLVVSKILLKKILELNPHHRVLDFGVTFMLVLLLDYCFTEKQSGKKDLIGPVSLSGFKVIFILLTEPVAI